MKTFYGFNDLNIPIHPTLFRLWLWLKRPLRCKFGFHIFSEDEYGCPLYDGGRGRVDFFCKKCQKKIKTVAIDDLAPEMQKRVFGLIQTATSEITDVTLFDIFGVP